MNTGLKSTEFNTCISKSYRLSKKKSFIKVNGEKLYYYKVLCANEDCNNIFDIKKSIWETNLAKEHPCIHTCSQDCKGSESVKGFLIKNFKRKHGVENSYQLEKTKKAIKKTNMERYGVENCWQSEEKKQKIRDTLIERYGVDNAQKNKEIKNRTIKTRNERYKNDLTGFCRKSTTFKTNIEKYGNKWFFASDVGTQSLDAYIRLHGEELGTSKFKLISKSKAITLEKFILKYGIAEGNLRYNNWKKTCAQNLDNFVLRHGEKDGTELYHAYVKNRIGKALKNGKHSKLNDRFDDILLELVQPDEYIRELPLRYNSGLYFYDFCLFDKLIIEVHGDYWHCNPKTYTSGDFVNHPGKKNILVDDIWKKDIQKKNEAEANGYTFIHFWETDILNKPDEIKQTLKKIIADGKN